MSDSNKKEIKNLKKMESENTLYSKSAPMDIPIPKCGNNKISGIRQGSESQQNSLKSNHSCYGSVPKNKTVGSPEYERQVSSKVGSAGSSGIKSPLGIHKKLLHSISRSSHYTGSGSLGGSRINVVTDSCSFIPSLTSTFSLDVVQSPTSMSPPINKRLLEVKHLGNDLGEATQVSTSYQDHLDVEDLDMSIDDPHYQDTITSNDSAASLLRRTFSLPSGYQYQKAKPPLHAREIWKDFLPSEKSSPEDEEQNTEKDGVYSSHDSFPSSRNIYQPSNGWRQTMGDLLERSEYIDSLESKSSSTGLLALAARSYATKHNGLYNVCEEVDELEISDEQVKVDLYKTEKKRLMKNLLILSSGFTCTFTAYIALRNLASSLYHEGGLGMLALCTVYASLVLNCIFSTSIVMKLRPKYTMVLCFIGFLIYALCNFYPSYYTLLPAAAIAGFCLANSWTAQATYLANNAASYAVVTGEPIQNVLSTFNGIFYLFFQSSQVIGGVISSFVLMSQHVHQLEPVGNESATQLLELENFTRTHGLSNFSHCGSAYCHNQVVDSFSVDINPNSLYLLLGILTTFAIAGILIVFFFLDPLEGSMSSSKRSTQLGQLTAVFKIFGDWRTLCLVPYVLYTLVQMSFMFGEYTKAFVTCSMGVYMVGYVMLTVALCCAISSYVGGKIQQYTGRSLLVVLGCFTHMGLLFVMLFWTPHEDTIYVMFLIAGGWGAADGILNTQLISLFGILFADNKPPAFACLKMLQAMGAFTFFLSATYLCTYVKIYILMGILMSTLLGYTTLEVALKEQNNANPVQRKLKGPTDV